MDIPIHKDRELKQLLDSVMIGCVFPGGIAASILSGDFGAMLFSRDSLRMMLDLMRLPEWRPLCRQMFSVLPQWQGTKHDDSTNERPDALQHQVFRQIVGGIQLPDKLVDNVRYWTDIWGVELRHDSVEGENFVVYNSSDAPLLYLIALGQYIRITDDDSVLSDRFYHRPTGNTRTVADAASRCLDYIVNAVRETETAGLGTLYAVPNTNPKQTSPSGKLEDGFDSVLRPVWSTTGALTAEPVDYGLAAYIDHQSLAVWALELGATTLFPTDNRAKQWLRTAQSVSEETLGAFWMDDQEFFGVAIDKDGLSRLETLSALEMLNGTILKGVRDAPDYVRSLVRWAYSPEVLTPVGPRMTSIRFQPMWGIYNAYQGPPAVWPVRTNTAFTGFLNWGLPYLAADMGIERNLGLIRRSGMCLEATYVDPLTGIPMYDPLRESQKVDAADIVIYPSSPPQRGQGWTASSGLSQLRWAESFMLGQGYAHRAEAWTWQAALENELSGRFFEVPPASRMLEEDSSIAADYARGDELKKEFAERLGLSA